MDYPEKVKISEQLADLPIEKVLKIKEKLGTKVFNESVKGNNSVKPKTAFSRDNKNRPREMSSKIPVDIVRPVVPVPKNKFQPRDPRFDSTCGEFNEKQFNKSYSFIKDIRKKEMKKLIKEFNKETDEERKAQIKFLIQRMKNKELEEKRKLLKQEAEKSESFARKQAVKDGKKPHFYKKSEKKIMDLMDNYETLKKTGKLKKHIDKKVKKLRAKGFKNKL